MMRRILAIFATMAPFAVSFLSTGRGVDLTPPQLTYDPQMPEAISYDAWLCEETQTLATLASLMWWVFSRRPDHSDRGRCFDKLWTPPDETYRGNTLDPFLRFRAFLNS